MLVTELLAGTPGDVLTRVLGLPGEQQRGFVPELGAVLRDGLELVLLDNGHTYGARDPRLAERAAVALLATVPPRDPLLGELRPPEPELTKRILLARPPRERAALAGWLVEWQSGWDAVRVLAREGELEPVRTPEYFAGWFRWSRRDLNTPLAERLRAEPGALDEVWELLPVEGIGDASFAAFDKYVPVDCQWSTALAELSRTGELDRARLLETSLEVLARDFAVFRARWYASLHEALTPSPVERAGWQHGYARLCGSGVPSTVGFAVKALAAVQKAGLLDAEVALRHLPAAAAGRGAGTAKLAVRLAAKAGQAAAGLAGEVFAAAATHESAEVRELAAAHLGTRVETPARVEPVAYPEPVLPPFAERRLLVVPLEVPDSPAAVAEAFSALLADHYQGDLLLAALDGAHRVAGDELRDALKPLVKRAVKADTAHAELMPKLLSVLVRGLAGREVEPPELVNGWSRPLRHRMRALLAGNARPVSAATHLGGWLDPVVFVRRLARRPEAALDDVVDGLLRLAPDTRAEALELAAQLTGPYAVAVRFALGGPETPARDWLGLAAAKARHPEAADPVAVLRGEPGEPFGWSARLVTDSFDLIRLKFTRTPAETEPDTPWLGTLNTPPVDHGWEGFTSPHEVVGAPYDRAVLEAEVARDLFENDVEVGYPSEVYGLSPFLDRPAVPSYPGLLMIAAALNTQRASGAQLGVDAALSLLDARQLGPRALGQALGVFGGELTLTRLTKRLSVLAGEHPAAVLSTVDALLPLLDRSARGLSALLELAVDLAERGAGTVSPATGDWLAGLTGSSKAAKAALRLLR
ncbi:DUF6493 family protein [Crossiella sp. CA-258035]|uniref:DUF6493 family protein n=1 Tax=Crossiella sp. CA-258035 TaxID=2981138 RepID=UPI0024BC7D3A|nr:DUF6493 family protein [Crossiella sp. CA-258035]WHT15829.1 DUF6493 family protein [Crossiella sp. CA-258035]